MRELGGVLYKTNLDLDDLDDLDRTHLLGNIITAFLADEAASCGF
jgi:hypothetical protein